MNFDAIQPFGDCPAGASRDPPEKQAPMCTLHSFPHTIDHCLTFARSEFEGLLEHSPAEANAFLLDPEKCPPPPLRAWPRHARTTLYQQHTKQRDTLSRMSHATLNYNI